MGIENASIKLVFMTAERLRRSVCSPDSSLPSAPVHPVCHYYQKYEWIYAVRGRKYLEPVILMAAGFDSSLVSHGLR